MVFVMYLMNKESDSVVGGGFVLNDLVVKFHAPSLCDKLVNDRLLNIRTWV